MSRDRFRTILRAFVAMGMILAAWPASAQFDIMREAVLIAIEHDDASGGRVPGTEGPLISPNQAKYVGSLMLTCGTYDCAGEFAYRVGLPGKSGVGGGIVAIMPGQFSAAVWSPGLGPGGNSLAGTKALELLTTKTGISIF